MLNRNVLDRFHVLGRFARGGMGDLWLAEDLDAHEVLLKTVRRELRDNPHVRLAFQREIEITALLHHDHLVHHVAHGIDLGADVLVIDRIRGIPVDELAQSRVPLAAALAVASDVADGLAHAHELSDDIGIPLAIVHGDVSPQNVLVDLKGRSHLVDFGAATQRSMAQAPQLVCKPAYMSPEQARGAVVDARSDQYSFGVFLWEMIVGRELFSSDRFRGDGVIPPITRFVEVPPGVEALVFRMLARDRDARFPDMRSVADTLAAMLPLPCDAHRVLALRVRGAPVRLAGVQLTPARHTQPTLDYVR